MNKETIEQNTIFLTIAGSRAYGTSTPESDTDVRGVCIIPDKAQYFGYGNVPMTPIPLCMPDDCKIIGDPVASYRKYYLTHKKHLLKYTKREVPSWIKGESL